MCLVKLLTIKLYFPMKMLLTFIKNSLILIIISKTIGCNFAQDTYSFKEKGEIGIAFIYDIQMVPKNKSYSIRYKYYVHSKSYEGVSGLGSLSNYLQINLSHKYFPILYLPENPKKSKILITKRDFEIYGLEFPDSLSWVEKYW
jgi:hypothetical protein